MHITRIEPFILHVPVTGSQIADSTHSITHWGVVGARIDTDTGEILTETRLTRVPPPKDFRALSAKLKGTTNSENTGEHHGQGD